MGVKTYAYAANNPVMRLDRNGLQEETPGEKECMTEWDRRYKSNQEDKKCMDKVKSVDGCFLIKQSKRLEFFRLICRESKTDYLKRVLDPVPDAGPKPQKRRPIPGPIPR